MLDYQDLGTSTAINYYDFLVAAFDILFTHSKFKVVRFAVRDVSIIMEGNHVKRVSE
jgi:hypothetical protein